MSEESSKPPQKPEISEKEARLKAALRANLRRRKAAARKSGETDRSEGAENGPKSPK